MPVKAAAGYGGGHAPAQTLASTPPQPKPRKKPMPDLTGEQPYVGASGIRVKVQVMFSQAEEGQEEQQRAYACRGNGDDEKDGVISHRVD